MILVGLGQIVRVLNSRPLLWALLALPAFWLLSRWAGGRATYGDVVSRTGAFAAQLLLLTVALAPLRLLFRRAQWLTWLMDRRADFGIVSVAYAGTHMAAYTIGKYDLVLMVREAAQPWLLAGWAAFPVALVLTATRTDTGKRVLGRSWTGLQHSIHAAVALVALHWLLQAFDPLTQQVQEALDAYGYYSGPIDGIVGPMTHDALEHFQRDHGLSVTGTITPEVLDRVGIVPN